MQSLTFPFLLSFQVSHFRFDLVSIPIELDSDQYPPPTSNDGKGTLSFCWRYQFSILIEVIRLSDRTRGEKYFLLREH